MSIDDLRFEVYTLAFKLYQYDVIADIVYLSMIELIAMHSYLLRVQEGC